MSDNDLMNFEEIDIDELPFPPDDEPVDIAEDITEYVFIETAEKENETFNNSNFYFAEGVSRSLNDFKTRLNNNIIVVGTSGCGKTTSFVEPNLLTYAGSFVVSESKRTLYEKHKAEMEAHGYTVLTLDFQEPPNGLHYSPFSTITNTQDIVRIAHTLVYDKTVSGRSIDPFWDNSNVLFVSALICYMYETGYKPFNFKGLLQLMNEGDRFSRHGTNDDFRYCDEKASKLRDRFEKLHKKSPNSWAYKQFKSVDQATDKTYDSIRVTLASKFANYTSEELDKMMSSNDIDFEKIAKEKTVVFVLQSDSDRSLDGLVNLFFSQAMYSLIKYADTCPNQRLPIPVRFFLDDYGATTAIDNLDTIISTIRSRAISVSLILQSEAQLKCSKEGADKTILSNCDTYIYMGGNDVDTAKAVSVRCNKPLEQILYMPVGKCWVFERGKKPVYTDIIHRPDLDAGVPVIADYRSASVEKSM